MSIPGFATPESTREFAGRFKNHYPGDAFTSLGTTDLQVSRLGFGTYRCQQGNEMHFTALQKALALGCNIIDTSANYGDGGAESLIGEVLNKEVVWGEIRREQVVLVSKAGYLQGENLEIAVQREQTGNPFPEVVKYGEGIWHCIHPQFLEDQITRSLARLHIDTLDVYLLHNPEYFLLDARNRGEPNQKKLQDEFYYRIHQAFLALEKMAAEGLIRYYGISSNTLTADPEDIEFVSLARIRQVYENICYEKNISPEQGHFAVIQLPFNWIENRAFTAKNNLFHGKSYSVLELAQELNLGVLTNRPLNAIRENRLFRLARYPFDENLDYPKTIDAHLAELHEYERRIVQEINSMKIDFEIERQAKLSDLFRLSERLRGLMQTRLQSEEFNQILLSYFIPMLQLGRESLQKRITPEKRDKTEALLSALNRQFTQTAKILQEYYSLLAYEQVKSLEETFENRFPEMKLPFSQKALLITASTPGIDVVLNGMRRPEYVEDSMAVLAQSPVDVKQLFK